MERKNRAVILRVIDYSEADRLVTLFTEDFGKIRGVAKNAKKSQRRFGGGLEHGSIGSVRYVEKPGTELVRLEEMLIEVPAWKVATSLAKIFALYISLELADKMLPLAHASRERFGLLERWISFLASTSPLPVHRHAFYYKWLAASGLAPVFDRCVVCFGPPSPAENDPCFIESAHGGIVCKKCHSKGRNFVEIGGKLLHYLHELKFGRLPGGTSFDAVPTGRQADEVFEYLIMHAIGGEIKSLNIARRVGE